MVVHPYNDQFVKLRRTSLTLLKNLGYGTKFVEARIGIELEDLVEKIRKLNGRPFIPNDMLFQCNTGVIMSFMFGRQFDYNKDPLMRHVNSFVALALEVVDPKLDLFPVLLYLPRYRRLLEKTVASKK